MEISNIYKVIVLQALACLALVSCSEKEPGIKAMSTVTISAESGVMTKTQIGNSSVSEDAQDIWWTPGDKLGVFSASTSNAAFTTAITSAAPTADFSGSLAEGEAPTKAYYPYSASNSNASDLRFNVARNQSYTGLTSISESDIKVSQTIEDKSGSYRMTFKSLTSLLKFTINFSGLGLDASENVQGVILESVEGRPLTGEFSVNLDDANVALSPVDGSTNSAVALALSSSPVGSTIEAYANVYPGLRSGDKLKVTVTTTSNVISYTVNVLGNFLAGEYYDIPLNSTSAIAKDDYSCISGGRKAIWDNGGSFNFGGAAFSQATTELNEVLLTSNTTVNDASYQNTIIFLEKDVELTFGPSAVLSNTIIVNNEADEVSYVKSSTEITASGNPGYVAFWDVDLNCGVQAASGLGTLAFEECTFNGLSSGLFEAGSSSYVKNLLVNKCDWKVASDGLYIVDGGSAVGSSFENLVISNNTIHSSSSAVRTMNWVENASGLTLKNVYVVDNMMLNVAGSELINVAGTGTLTLQRNHFNLGAAASDIVMYSSTNAPTGTVTCGSNTVYCASGCELTAVSAGSVVEAGDAATANPLSSVNVAEGTYTLEHLLVAASSVLDDITAGSVDYSINTVTLLHNPGTGAILPSVMPWTSYSESGAMPSKTLTLTCGTKSESYVTSLPDAVSSSDIQTISSVGTNWTLVWTDEFNGTDWDRNVWTRCPADTPAWAQEQYPADESLAVVENGMLKTYAKVAESGEGANGYKAGGIWGKDLKSFNLGMNGVTGRIDVCATMSDAKAFWPAIWMMPQQDSFSWPQWGEIDIMEHLNFDSSYYATLHTWHDGALNKGTYTDYSCSNTANFTNRTSEHVFSVIVKDGSIMLAIDGSVTLTCKKSDHGVTSSSTIDYRRDYWPYDATEYYLILDSQINGWPGTSDGTNLPAYMNIQYVRYMVQE